MSRFGNKYVIGLTGNIAVGKSVVRQMLQHLGAYTVDADGLTHQAMSPGAPAYRPIIETFGQVILNPDKSINRGMLGNMVFGNPALLAKLEAIVHPVVGQAINTLVSRAKQPIVVIEAIKLVEGDLGKACNAIWVVDAQPKSQYVRLIQKRKMSEDEAKQRILSQNSQKEKLKSASVVIHNDSNLEETWKQVQIAWNAIPMNVAPAPTPVPTPKPASAPQSSATSPKPASAPSPTPQPTAPKPVTSPLGTILVKRGMPNNAELIAGYLSRATGKNISRADVMMNFGQKSYMLAENNGRIIAVVGWQVENLITRVDEIYIDAIPERPQTVYALAQRIEDASKELQSEVSFVFLSNSTANELGKSFLEAGYEMTDVKDIKIPAWRESVQEVYSDGIIILTKKLRTDRVLKPI
ncbi:MAG: dephospho-CoA kinase [Phototrophicales bacterium]|nr:dephospho-CoA kinase [Phototrophicales bacterium]